MKRHITTKQITKTPEKSRDSIIYDSPKLIHSSEKERDKIVNNINEAVIENYVNLKCKYWTSSSIPKTPKIGKTTSK